MRWLGVEAGRAWATLHADGARWRVEVGARSAGWVSALYPVDDRMTSWWAPGTGSTRYDTEFHEGRFEQRQRMLLGVPQTVVERSQLRDGAWVDSVGHYRGEADTHDPVSALYQLRVAPPSAESSARLRVFNGRDTLTLDASTAASVVAKAGYAAREVTVRSAAAGDYAGSVTCWLSDDADAIPVAAAIETRAGTVTLVLVDRQDPTP